ncbi:MAG: hypothetical protein ACTSW1_10000 [Candidatus Hodarchaeales archaeon]
MPEYILPSNLQEGTKEHALYLTYVISVDYMVNAVKLWKNSREEYYAYPEHFQPETILGNGDQSLRTIVKRIGARFPSTGAKTWKAISEVLIEKYGGDPRQITEKPSSIKEIKTRLADFPYLKGNKLSNFYLRAMSENQLFKITDFDELDIPVDIQVARFSIYTGVLSLDEGTFRGCVHEEPLRSLIEDAWRDAARKLETYPWKLDEPIWTIGSKLCSKKKCGQCPVRQYCDKNFHVIFKNAIALWN